MLEPTLDVGFITGQPQLLDFFGFIGSEDEIDNPNVTAWIIPSVNRLTAGALSSLITIGRDYPATVPILIEQAAYDNDSFQQLMIMFLRTSG
jgi:hypothetical protein